MSTAIPSAAGATPQPSALHSQIPSGPQGYANAQAQAQHIFRQKQLMAIKQQQLIHQQQQLMQQQHLTQPQAQLMLRKQQIQQMQFLRSQEHHTQIILFLFILHP
ncbi:hypothetical protein G6F53_010141 [Rhizopus delemar]|nr:hypothetical protein G6F53_010141 [Rhizopus delemar]